MEAFDCKGEVSERLGYSSNAHIIGGVFGSGKGEEFELKDRGSYIPLSMPVNELPNLNIKPYDVAQSLFDFTIGNKVVQHTKKTIDIAFRDLSIVFEYVYNQEVY